jgi:hypothetical protein
MMTKILDDVFSLDDEEYKIIENKFLSSKNTFLIFTVFVILSIVISFTEISFFLILLIPLTLVFLLSFVLENKEDFTRLTLGKRGVSIYKNRGRTGYLYKHLRMINKNDYFELKPKWSFIGFFVIGVRGTKNNVHPSYLSLEEELIKRGVQLKYKGVPPQKPTD